MGRIRGVAVAGGVAMALAASVGFGAVADFEGGASSSNGYTGSTDSGWQGGWTLASLSSSAVTLTNSSPIVSGGNNYLAVSTSSNSGALTRQLGTGSHLYTDQYTISFDLRVDSAVGGNNTLVIASNSSSNSGATSGNTAINIYNRNGYWNIYNTIATTVPVAANMMYRFEIDVNPTTATYDVSISYTDVTNGLTTFSHTGYAYRSTTEQYNQSWLAFKAISGSGFSLDNLSVTAVPEPAALGLICLSGLLLIKRR